MFWVIQNNVACEERYEDFIKAVDGRGDEYAIVKVITFINELTPDINPSSPTMVYGSVSLAKKIAHKKGWMVFSNDNFDFNIWKEKWKGHILNEDATVGEFGNVELPNPATEFFIRPVKDNKAFTGTVMEFHEYKTLLGRLLANEKASDIDFDVNEIVMVSSVKDIQQEIRFFVVNGEVVTHSMYSVNGITRYHEETMTDPVAVDFVREMINIWMPDKAFVLDIARVDNDYKIIEINCINCAGLYNADAFKLVDALSQISV